ncbi:MAG: 16S rRNA (cytosine(1402)-N(4))-methyltransferase RsmH [Defluviitaleaceae bacterium]|nr:16S rRNA (cytosine(1402)-N(4))-methyltransferase RsmH [Defluviitaleaceae bacterium]
MNYQHSSVMLAECISALEIRPDGTYVDCTLGGGGHSLEIAKRLTRGGRLVGVDQDANAIAHAGRVLAEHSDKLRFVKGSFFDIKQILETLDIARVDGFLADIGVSSHQLDEPSRGFSYMHDAPLDMRMDESAGFSAADVVNGYGEPELARIISTYGEERFARRIAALIVKQRPINTTLELVSVIKQAIPARARESGQHPAKRTFQAVRIEVNSEIAPLGQAIEDMAGLLAPGGRIAVISFHSLEDRAVKNTFRALEGGCNCPRDFPLCVCNNPRTLQVVTRKPITPGDAELASNHRARSAKLRVAERVDESGR